MVYAVHVTLPSKTVPWPLESGMHRAGSREGAEEVELVWSFFSLGESISERRCLMKKGFSDLQGGRTGLGGGNKMIKG